MVYKYSLRVTGDCYNGVRKVILIIENSSVPAITFTLISMLKIDEIVVVNDVNGKILQYQQ